MLDNYGNVNIYDKEIQNKIFIVMPFYKNMYGFKKLCVDFIVSEAKKGQNVKYQEIVSKLNLIMSFKKTDTMDRYCKHTR